MNKLYFVKKLPTNEKFKEDDKVFHPKLGWVYLGYYSDGVWDCKKVTEDEEDEEYTFPESDLYKLYLCSKDIQVDDEIIIPNEVLKMYDFLLSNKAKCTSIELEKTFYHFVAPTIIGGKLHSGVSIKDKPFKILGKISLDAIWITEEMEFDKEEFILLDMDADGMIAKFKCDKCLTWH